MSRHQRCQRPSNSLTTLGGSIEEGGRLSPTTRGQDEEEEEKRGSDGPT